MKKKITTNLLNLLESKISSNNNKKFFRRIWETDFSVYEARLKKIGFVNKASVIDIGGGYGQWAVVLAKLNSQVTLIEYDSEKIRVLNLIKDILQLKNLNIVNSSANTFKYSSIYYDAIFTYSMLYFTNWKVVLADAISNMSQDGIIYLNTNDIGWYLYNFIKNPNPAKDFSPRKMAIKTLAKFILGDEKTPNCFQDGQIIMPVKSTLNFLKSKGISNISNGPDGSCGDSSIDVQSFFINKFFCYSAVYEVLGYKL